MKSLPLILIGGAAGLYLWLNYDQNVTNASVGVASIFSNNVLLLIALAGAGLFIAQRRKV